MKKRIICLLLALVMALGLCLTSCLGGSTPGGGDGGDDDGGNDDGGNDGSGDGGSGGSGGQSGNGKPVENADILALSYDRLENADLSFNFDFGFGSGAKAASVRLASRTEENDGTHAYYSVSPDDLGEPEIKYDYFKDEEGFLEMLSNNARRLADFMIEKITVMDTVVIDGYSRYILSYDSETDTLRAITYTVRDAGSFGNEGGGDKDQKPIGLAAYTEPADNIQTITEVKIYYDEAGCETVEMWNLSEDNSTSIEHVIYTAGKQYTISRAFIGEEFSNYSTTSAYKDNGLWRAVSAHFSPDNTLLTKEGVYDYGNGLLFLTFLIETPENVYTFSDSMRPFRDGVETNSGVEALPTDEVRILPYSLWAPGISIDIKEDGLILINTAYLTGWEEYRITIDSEYELGNFQYNEHYFTSDKDYLLTEGGVKLYSGENGSSPAWSPEYGWGELAWSSIHSCECFVDEHGVEHLISEGVHVVRIFGALAQINRNTKELMTANIYFRGGFNNQSYPEHFAAMQAYFDFLGLSFVDGISENFFGDLAGLMVNRDKYTASVFEKVFSEDYTFDGYKNAIAKVMASMNEYKDGFLTYLAGVCEKDAVNMDDQPTRPENFSLISFAGGISGSGVITENGFDFTSVSFLARKNVILSEGASYTVVVTLSSKDLTVMLDAFSTATFAHTDMTFTGKSGALPEGLAEGEYVLCAYLARVNGEGEVVRLSEVAPMPITEFDGFNYQVEGVGGYYRYTYAYESGAAGVLVEFFDTAAPTVVANGLTTEVVDEKTYYIAELTEGVGIDALLSLVSVTDNYDGEIYPTATDVTKEGEDTALAIGYLLEDGGKYLLTVSDAAGNKTEVLFSVTLLPEGTDTPGGSGDGSGNDGGDAS